MKKGNVFAALLSKLPLLSKLSGPERSQAGKKAKYGIPQLDLAFFIFDWSQLRVISDVFAEEKTGFHFISKASGTASSEILDLLGIGASSKAVVSCLEKPGMAPVLLEKVRKRLASNSPGAGIAFTVPMSGINTPILRFFRQPDEPDAENEKNTNLGSSAGEPWSGVERRHSRDASYALILSVVNRDYSGELMNTARKAGAEGGTVISARCQTQGGAVQYFDILVQEERELVMILTSRNKKDAIMQAINGTYGISSKAQGIVFSLPVNRVISLSSER